MRIPYSRMLATFALAASAMFGNPRGEVESRGRYQSHTKKGRGRRPASRHSPCLHGAKWLPKHVMRRGH